MTTTKELVHTFKAQGGRTEIIPQGTSGEVKHKSVYKQSDAYSRKRYEIRQARLDATMHGREKHGCSRYAPVDVFMQFRNDKGI